MSVNEIQINRLNKRIVKNEIEKKLLISRLSPLLLTSNPYINTREQEKIEIQINKIKNRLSQVESELKKDKFHLNRISGIIPINSDQINRENKLNENKETHKHKINKLEVFLNETMSTFRTPIKTDPKNSENQDSETLEGATAVSSIETLTETTTTTQNPISKPMTTLSSTSTPILTQMITSHNTNEPIYTAPSYTRSGLSHPYNFPSRTTESNQQQFDFNTKPIELVEFPLSTGTKRLRLCHLSNKYRCF